jgi:hypothetical protein
MKNGGKKVLIVPSINAIQNTSIFAIFGKNGIKTI